jgi:hypothetical protein
LRIPEVFHELKKERKRLWPATFFKGSKEEKERKKPLPIMVL